MGPVRGCLAGRRRDILSFPIRHATFELLKPDAAAAYASQDEDIEGTGRYAIE